jgi:acetylglutamate kinase
MSVHTAFLNSLLASGCMPVIAPLVMGENGEILNTNADLAASAIASALKAEKLVYLSDIEGVLVSGALISTLTKSRSIDLIRENAITGGMIPKVRSAFDTLDAGVQKVHIIDGRVKHSLLLEIFTDEGIGTQMVPEETARMEAQSGLHTKE